MKNVSLPGEFEYAPAVFAVGNEYRICALAKSPLLFWVTVGEHTFYDAQNGILRSARPVHEVAVPMALLDREGSYTVHYRKVIERKPYFPESEEEVCVTYPFRPVPTKGPVRMYHLADTHGGYEAPAAAVKFFGDDLDLLILNGDIPNHSGTAENFHLIYALCEAATGGQRTCLFSRGNHDMRGVCAEELVNYVPTDKGNSYFTFRVGGVWGLVLDAGEDKPESHDAYGGTNVCHGFRLAQTEFIKSVIARADSEYAAEGVQHKVVVCHHPFTYRMEEPFNIDEDVYEEWADLLAAHVKPEALISGHLHRFEVKPQGGELDKGGNIPVVVGSALVREEKKVVSFTGAAITLSDNGTDVLFTNEKKETVGSAHIG